MKTKLTYIGFLGLLGFDGFFGTPWLFCFFGYFSFFSYIKVVPDELFWINVRQSATIAFFIMLVLSSLVIVLGLTLFQSYPSISAGVMLAGLAISQAICEGVFLLTLSYLEKKEKEGILE